MWQLQRSVHVVCTYTYMYAEYSLRNENNAQSIPPLVSGSQGLPPPGSDTTWPPFCCCCTNLRSWSLLSRHCTSLQSPEQLHGGLHLASRYFRSIQHPASGLRMSVLHSGGRSNTAHLPGRRRSPVLDVSLANSAVPSSCKETSPVSTLSAPPVCQTIHQILHAFPIFLLCSARSLSSHLARRLGNGDWQHESLDDWCKNDSY